MIKYTLLTLGSFGFLIYKLLVLATYKVGQFTPRSEYYNLIVPILLSISAGLFITKKTKVAGIYGLFGVAIASKDILANWLIIDLVSSKYLLQYYSLVILTTIYLVVLVFITIKTLLSNENENIFEIISYEPKGTTAQVISFIPTFVVVIATISWITIRLSS